MLFDTLEIVIQCKLGNLPMNLNPVRSQPMLGSPSSQRSGLKVSEASTVAQGLYSLIEDKDKVLQYFNKQEIPIPHAVHFVQARNPKNGKVIHHTPLVSVWKKYIAPFKQFLNNGSFAGLDLSKCDLSGTNFTGSNFLGTILKGSKLTDAIMSYTLLEKTNLRQAILKGTDFSYSTMNQAFLDKNPDKFKAVKSLRGVTIQQTPVRGTDFSNKDMTGATLAMLNLSNASFKKTNLRDANFSGSILSGSDFTSSDLTGSNFSMVNRVKKQEPLQTLKGTNFTKANMDGVDFSLALLPNANLEGAVITSAQGSNGEILNYKGQPDFLDMASQNAHYFEPAK
jgi:uncharacterized protein YjbI with pentapeptide repeats